MASNSIRSAYFSAGIALRAAAIAGLVFLAIYLAIETQYYATILVLAGIALFVTADIARAVAQIDRRMVSYLEAARIGSSDLPRSASSAMRNVAASAAIERRERMRDGEYLQALIDSVAACLIVIRPDGTITLANRAAWKLAGRSVNHLSDIAALGDAAAAELAGLMPAERRIIKCADGQSMLASIAQFFAPGEAPYRMVSLQAIAGELSAVEIKAWHDMTRIMAHEIMNSLTPIASLSESLAAHLGEDTLSAKDMVDAIETIGRRSQGLMQFVERYRKLASLPQPQLRPMNLSGFAAEIDRLMRVTMAERKISYSHRASADIVFDADTELLTQATINLLNNALDAVSKELNPTIAFDCLASGEDEIVIAVIDNGPGLGNHTVEDIFVPFFTTKSGGSGIGLSFARHVAMHHRGRVEVQPNDPHGCIFRIILPAL